MYTYIRDLAQGLGAVNAGLVSLKSSYSRGASAHNAPHCLQVYGAPCARWTINRTWPRSGLRNIFNICAIFCVYLVGYTEKIQHFTKKYFTRSLMNMDWTNVVIYSEPMCYNASFTACFSCIFKHEGAFIISQVQTDFTFKNNKKCRTYIAVNFSIYSIHCIRNTN